LGRLQYVDVEEGPVARHFGIAQVKLHTASASTDAELPGIPREQAAQLRKEISELAETNLEGI
jgi:membrane protein YdbS with pleckstrin-like domain